ncbi:MAG TPA: hypothetical protein VFG39_03240, partial [Balneolaceae bacterium]|nr:hypothetical protein [Balneolaceae bacterium]
MKNHLVPGLLVLSLSLLFATCKKAPTRPEPDPGQEENPIGETGEGTIILTGTISADSVLTDVFADPERIDYKIVDSLAIEASVTVKQGVVINAQGILLDIKGSLNFESGVRMLGGDNHIDIRQGSKMLLGQHFSLDITGSLNIEPGGTILSGKGNLILVSGTLIAEGTKTDSVTFSSLDKAVHWSGILIEPGAQVSMNYADISYAGGEGGGAKKIKSALRIAGGTISIENSRIHHNDGHGIYLNAHKKAFISFSNNTFVHN